MTELEKAIAMAFAKIANDVSTVLADELFKQCPEHFNERELDSVPYPLGEGLEDFEDEAKAVIKMVVSTLAKALEASPQVNN